MGILDELSDDRIWNEYFEAKLNKGHLSRSEEAIYSRYINEKRYKRIVDTLRDGQYKFDYPVKKYINKAESSKKRIVYSFNEDEAMVLRVMSYLLYKYDYFLCNNLFSFRRDCSPRQAIKSIVSHKKIDEMYCYKVDVSNYFNSINIDILLPILKRVFRDDERVYEVFREILTLDKAYFEGEVVCEKRGAMAGTPFSPFLANIYLVELDQYFEKNSILYARYSDDIICFADTKDELDEYVQIIKAYLDKYSLAVNKDKEMYVNPHESWSFLGVEYNDGTVDLSKATIMKMKGKIRRKARALYRWKLRKKAGNEQTVRAMIRIFNRKFFSDEKEAESTSLNWSRWFFPIINTSEGLKVIDEYLQMYLRYITTGKHGKLNYKLTYTDLKRLGYRSLVNEYYSFKQNR